MNKGLKQVGVWFLKSQYVRTLATGAVSAGVAAIVAKGFLPEEMQESTITYFTGAAIVGINLLAEHLLKDGTAKVQTQLNTTLAPEDQIKTDGVAQAETMAATKAITRAAPNDIEVPAKRPQPQAPRGGRGHG